MLWETVILLLAVSAGSISATSIKFRCPRGCDCSIALTVEKNLYDMKCTKQESLLKQYEYNSKQAMLVRKLDLSNTNMKKLNVDLINKLINLQVLDISNNMLIDLPHSINVPQLTDIIMHHNHISTISYWFFPKNVRYIDLAYNSLTQLPETLIDIRKLEEVRIVGNVLQCSCYNRNVYKELVKRSVIFDQNECQMENGETTTWRQLHITCTDNDFQNDQSEFVDLGSGDGDEVLNVNEEHNIVNDLDEFITVKNYDSTSTTTTIQSTTDDGVKRDDFYFENNRTTEDSLDSEGSGDYDDFITLDGSSEYQNVTDEDDGSSGSGDDQLIIPDDSDSSEDNTTASMPPITTAIVVSPSSTTVTEIISTTTENIEEIIPPPSIISPSVFEKIALSTENDLEWTTVNYLNEEIGEVAESDNKKQAFGTYIFLAILLAVVICLVGYMILKRRVNRQNSSTTNRRTNDDLDNATEMKDIDKTMSLLNEENEKMKKTNGLISETTPMITAPSANNNTPADNNCTNGVKKSSVDDLQPRTNDQSQKKPTTPTPSPRNLTADSPQSNNNQAEKVKITMTELTDSIPKTPVLVTRTKSSAGDQMLVTPNLNQRPNLRKP